MISLNLETVDKYCAFIPFLKNVDLHCGSVRDWDLWKVICHQNEGSAGEISAL